MFQHNPSIRLFTILRVWGCWLLMLGNAFPASAFHIIGGELYYTYLGNNQYEITLKIYRDCFAPNAAPFDQLAPIGIYNNGALITTLEIPFPGAAFVNDPNLSPCIVPPGNVCVERSYYVDTISLPPIPGGYDLVYERCCRNTSIVNLVAPDQTGSTYTAHIPDNTNGNVPNSNPRFNTLPPVFLCINTPLDYDHSASDPDGDSLVYYFCTPYSGASNVLPAPNPPSPPPFGSVTFTANYTSTYPLASNPSLQLNPQTGQLTGTPSAFGQYVVGVCVSEYRNGVFLSESKRDFQFNVLPCQNAIAAVPSQTTDCTGLSVVFDNSSVNSTSYLWDFGISGTTTDTSTAFEPTFTYPAPGTYTITLIASNGGGICIDTATTTFDILPLLAPILANPPSVCLAGNAFSLSVGGTYDPSASFQWTFPPGSNLPGSNLSTVNGLTLPDSGTYTAQVIISQFTCADTLEAQLRVHPLPQPNIGDATRYCVGLQVDFQNETSGTHQYLWNFGDAGTLSDTSILAEPNYLFPDTGIYLVTLAATDSNGCTNQIQEPFLVYPLLQPSIYPFNDSSFVNQCEDQNYFIFTASGSFSNQATLLWNFGSDASILQSTDSIVGPVSFASAGSFPITLTMFQNGCAKSTSDTVRVYQRPRIGPGIVGASTCTPFTVQLLDTSFAETPISYQWNMGDGSILSTSEPTYTYPNAGSYLPTLTIITLTGCKDTLVMALPDSIRFEPAAMARFVVDSQRVSIFAPTINLYDLSSGGISVSLSTGDGTLYGAGNLQHTYSDTGVYSVVQRIENAVGCLDSLVQDVYVYPEIRLWIPNAFSPNGDGRNERFLPVVLGAKTYSMLIKNRWGETVFSSEQANEGWDGTFGGQDCPQGGYAYNLTLYTVKGKTYERKGMIHLLR